MYYLQSRYYNPKIGRFINADGLVSTGQSFVGYNMFAYCGNNPVNRIDPSGHSWIIPSLFGPLWYPILKEIWIVLLKIFVPPVAPTHISEEGLQFIADYETFHSEPYDDGFGNMTIGYGHLIESNESFESITKQETLELLREELAFWETEVSRYSKSIGIVWDQHQYDAFVSLAYNSGYNFQTVMDMIAAGADPYESFSKIIHANGTRVLGLYRRRMDEADMFVMGTYKRTYRNWPNY